MANRAAASREKSRKDSDERLNDRVNGLVASGSLVQTEDGVPYFVPHVGPTYPLESAQFRLTAARLLQAQNLPVGPTSSVMKGIVGALAMRAVIAPYVRPRLLTSVERLDGRVLAIRVHLGNGVVVRITGAGIEPVANGHEGHLFTEEPNFTPLAGVSGVMPAEPGAIPALTEAFLDNLPPPAEDSALDVIEHRAIALAGFILIFLGGLTQNRPIVLAIGAAGTGKTDSQKVKVKLYLGNGGQVGGSASLDRVMKDVAAAAAHHAFVVRDDVSAFPPGALDTLNRIATGTAFALSEFHETLAAANYPSHGLLDLSAFNPEWLTRGDTNSRLFILKYGRPPASSVTQEQRLARALALRPRVWGEILRLLQGMLRDERPLQATTRFDDAEVALRRILRPTGLEDAFVSALAKMDLQRERAVREADPHIDVLAGMAQDPDVHSRTWLAAELAKEVLAKMGVQSARGPAFTPEAFGKYLARLERAGAVGFRIVRLPPGHAGRVYWWIGPKDGSPPGPGFNWVATLGAESKPTAPEPDEQPTGGVLRW